MKAMKVGQLAGAVERFCPFAAVTKFPYRHLYGDESEKVSQEYFAHGKFRSRGFTIFYINTLLDSQTKPLLLIPSNEVEALFKDIYNCLGVRAWFPDIMRHPGFEIGFQDGPRPRYLGRLTIDCSLLELEEMLPEPSEEEPEVVEDRSFPAFRRKMEAAILAGKNRQKNARDKKRRDRVTTKKGWCAQLKRAQCYLGLRPRGTVDKDDFFNDPNLTYEGSQAAQETYEEAAGLKLPKLFPTNPAPYPFDQSIVFVCIDVEAYEKDHKKITEIGISTLDTLDLQNGPPGEGGGEWMKKIRARHFRITENAHLKNTDFVTGCADKFVERFGTSEWISIKEAPQVIASCFRHPFSAPGDYYPYPTDINKTGRYGTETQHLPPVDDSRPKRKIVLVGHEIKADIGYMRDIGYDVTNLPNLLEAVDTADMFRAMKHEQNPRSLGAVLLELELVGWHLHNAGNDAGYTLEALIGIAFAALNVTHEPAPNIEQLNAAAADAQARLIEEIEEWEIADEEGGDGGEAVKLPSYNEMIENRTFEQGMRRANKAEEKQNLKMAGDRARCSGRGRGRGNGFTQEARPLQPSVERTGEKKFHSANEQKMRETGSRTPPHLKGKGKGSSQTNDGRGDEGTTKGRAPLADSMKARLAALDDDDDYFTI